MEQCFSCKSENLILDPHEGDLVCTSCGIVNKQHHLISVPTFYKGKKHGSGGGGAFLKSAKSSLKKKKKPFFTTKTFLATEITRREKIQNIVANIFVQLCFENDLIVARAMRVYDELIRKKINKVKKDELLSATLVFIVLRESNLSYSFNEVINTCNNVTKRELGRCLRRCYVFLQKTDINEKKLANKKKLVASVPRYASLLGFKTLEIMLLSDIVKKIENVGDIRGNSPLSILSAVFLFVALKLPGYSLNVKRTAAVLHIAENTISKSFLQIKKLHEEESVFKGQEKRLKKCIKLRETKLR